MEDLKQALVRANLSQSALLTVPWIVLQLGGFWGLADAGAGIAGVAGVGMIALVAFLVLAVYYHCSQIRLADLLEAGTGDDSGKKYAFFSFLRFWNDQLERVRVRIPGYTNTLRLNYIALPLAFLSCILNFWVAGLFMVLIWAFTGMLVRAAVVRSLMDEGPVIDGRGKFKMILLFTAAVASWGYVRYEAAVAEEICSEKVTQLQSESILLTASKLTEEYRLKGENGAAAVRSMVALPEIPERFKRLAAASWVENILPEEYVGLENFLFEHPAVQESLTKISRYPAARLGFDFEQGFAGMKNADLLGRYCQLEKFALLSFYSSAAIGNSRRTEENWNVMGALRRQLSGEPLLSGSRLVQEMETRRLVALERLINEFGIHSKKEAEFFINDLSVTEKELTGNLIAAWKGEMSLFLISKEDPLLNWSGNAGGYRSFARIFPVLAWSRSGSIAVYLEGMRKLFGAIAVPTEYKAFESWSRHLPCGVMPGVIALRTANETLLNYFRVVRKLRAGQVALHLDRYREARGGFPDALSQLKEMPAGMATDPMTGKELQYRKEAFEVESLDMATGEILSRKMDGAKVGNGNDFRIKR